MDTLSKPKRWTEIARELQQAQRSEIENRDRAIERHKGRDLFCPFDRRTIMGLPNLLDGRDEEM